MKLIALILVFYGIGLLVGWFTINHACTALVQKSPKNLLSPLFPGIVLPATAQQQAIYDLIRKGYPILEKENIRTWMIGGTLLGAIRCKGLIPWDDDVDLGYDDRQTTQLRKLGVQFTKKGLALTETWFGFKVHPVGSDPMVAPFLDLFPTTILSDGTTEFARAKARVVWPPEKESFRGTEMLFPLRKYQFGKTYLKGPQSAVPYLVRKFGNDWEYRAIIDPPHLPAMCSDFRRRLNRKSIYLKPSQRVCAPDIHSE